MNQQEEKRRLQAALERRGIKPRKWANRNFIRKKKKDGTKS